MKKVTLLPVSKTILFLFAGIFLYAFSAHTIFADTQIYPNNLNDATTVNTGYSIGSNQCTDGSGTYCSTGLGRNTVSVLTTESDGGKTYAQTGSAWASGAAGCCTGAPLVVDWHALNDDSANWPTHIPDTHFNDSAKQNNWAEQLILIPSGVSEITRVKFYNINFDGGSNPNIVLQLYDASDITLQQQTNTIVLSNGTSSYDFTNLNWPVTAGMNYNIRIWRTDRTACCNNTNSIRIPIISPCGGGNGTGTCNYHFDWGGYAWGSNGDPQAPHSGYDPYPSGHANSGCKESSSQGGTCASLCGDGVTSCYSPYIYDIGSDPDGNRLLQADVSDMAVWGLQTVSLSGKIIDASTGSLVANTSVTFNTCTWGNQTVITDASGNYTVPGLATIGSGFCLQPTITGYNTPLTTNTEYNTNMATVGLINIASYECQVAGQKYSTGNCGAYANSLWDITPDNLYDFKATKNASLGTLHVAACAAGNCPQPYAVSGPRASGLRSDDPNVSPGAGANNYNAIKITQDIVPIGAINYNLVAVAFTGGAATTGNTGSLTNLMAAADSGNGFVMLYANCAGIVACTDGGKTFTNGQHWIYLGKNYNPNGWFAVTNALLNSLDGRIGVSIALKMWVDETTAPDKPSFDALFYNTIGSRTWNTYQYLMDVTGIKTVNAVVTPSALLPIHKSTSQTNFFSHVLLSWLFF